MTQGIIIRTGLASLWLDKIDITNLMTFRNIMVRAPKRHVKTMRKSNCENFQYFLRRRRRLEPGEEPRVHSG